MLGMGEVDEKSEGLAVAVETQLGLRIGAPILVAVLILETTAHWFGTWGPEANVALGCLVLATPFAMLCLIRPPPLEYVHSGIAFVVALVVTATLAHVAYGTLASPEALLIIGMVVTAAFVLSRPWFLPLIAAQLAVWLLVVEAPGQLVAMPISVTLLTFAIHLTRRRGLHRTHLRQSELEAANAELHLAQSALDLAGDPILWIGNDGSVSYANESASRMLGYATRELAGMHIGDIDLQRSVEAWQQPQELQGSSIETLYRSKDGSQHPVETQSRLIEVDGRSFQCVIARDLSQRLRVEEKLRRAQRIESLGVLAGGLAHDFNNLLASMIGNTELALDALEPHSRARPMLDEVLEASDRATLLTKQLLAYAGGALADKQKLDVVHEIHGIANLLATSIPKGVDLEIEGPTDLPAVLADRAQLQQIVMNFVLNAGEAIGEAPGVVRVRTCSRDLDATEASRLEPAVDRTADRYVGFEVCDDGIGMDPATRARIFDPFFTTKSHGRGLGLAAVLGITRRHGGGIEVESREHEGSTFRLLLPAAGRVQSRQASPVGLPIEGGGVALVVDDEQALRRLARHSLEGFGFDVIEASDGVEGLEAVEACKDDLRLMLLDLTMPRMDGRAVIRAIGSIRPDLPIILTSGYDPEPDSMPDVEDRFVSFLKKPYRRGDLARSIREILSRADSEELDPGRRDADARRNV